MSVSTITARLRRDPGAALWAVAGACWLLLTLASTTGGLDLVQHHGVVAALTQGSRPAVLVLAGFTAAWLIMVAAMMLPTTVPMVRLFTVVSARQDRPNRVRALFLGAYFAVWLGFAFAALAGDVAVGALVDRWSWLRDRPSLVLAGALTLAGAFQFSSLKRRCLTVCRDPRAMLFAHYRRGPGGAWALGVRHAKSCLGCCWALMLVMFAVGAGSLGWMLGLTAVMIAEKTTRWGARLAAPIGVILLYVAVALTLDGIMAVHAPLPVHIH